MKYRKSILNKMEIFYKEVESKRKGKKTRLQTDRTLSKRQKIDLNKKFNIFDSC